MQLEEITEDIFSLSFDTQVEMSSTFLRFSEHYESPKFRGKTFTVDEFKQWYIQDAIKRRWQTTEKFTYYTNWEGYMVPSETLWPFYEGKFNPLSFRERKFLELFEDRIGKKFAVTGTYKGKWSTRQRRKKETLLHEEAHAFFYINPQYKEDTIEIMKSSIDKGKDEELNHCIIDLMGYDESVLQDEKQAIIISGIEIFPWYEIDITSLKDVQNKLKANFREYIQRWGIKN